MIRTTRLLPLLCFSLISSLIFCGEFVSDHDEPGAVKSDREQSISRFRHSNSDTDTASEHEDDVASSSPVRVALSPARKLSLPTSTTPLSGAVSTSPLTTTTPSQTTSSSSSFTIKAPNQPMLEESKLPSSSPFQPRSSERPERTFRRRSSNSSLNSHSSSTTTQTRQSASSSSSSSRAATAQLTNEHGSPEIQRRNLSHAVAETALMMNNQGAAPVARAETGFLDKLWSTAQPYVQCQRTITETAIKDNTFCEKYPTEPSRFSAISGALTELTLQAEQKLDQDYLVRAKKVLTFAHQNNVPVLEKQSHALLVTLQSKQREYAELNALLIAHTAQTTTKARSKKPLHDSKSKKQHARASDSD